ncbi:PAS domain-containing hybrid sensor histidine kinase/response regulator [Yoonia sediminilitoris]|uniref:histidine kinase n=1 Tax=Yoonia sediminilitoris TaxID=1286148 RepID=A0A2T6KN27_9RHOB|nr:PAS domain-containing hybrid sensor histidine kinase/response regulator [Yoonia sediminilitoris]PUB17616.1 PAS domain S-box-containing protein [Yoonia sediminilitoris]RCW97911.1 PAS domain S-box-containing protein [Yoonia sediminilitoris]
MANEINWGGSRKSVELLGQHVAMWRWELASDRVQWSDDLLEILGIERSEILGSFKAFAQLAHPDDAIENERLVELHLNTGNPYRFRIRMRHADGHYISMLSQGTALRDADGTAVEMIGTMTGMSDNVAAITRQVENEQTFRSLTDNVPGAIFQYLVGPTGTDAIRYMSSGCRDIWELSPAEIEDIPTRIWDLVHQDDLAGMQESVLASAEKMQFWTYRWRIVTPSGKVKHLDGRGIPKTLADGSISWDCVIVDITSEEELRCELVRQQEILGQVQKMDTIGRIAGGIAHDFNNLLAIVLGNAELIKDTGLPPDEIESFDAIIRACTRGGELTRRLLSFARKSPLEPEDLDANDVVAQLGAMISRIMPESISIKTILQHGLWECHADRSFLENSLLNLCINARDAMDTGGKLMIETQNIHLTQADPEAYAEGMGLGDYVAISVTDTGTGIPSGNISKVIEPFFSTKGPDLGTGLGLAMVHGFAQQSAGTLLIESQLGEGTRIRLLLPSNALVAGRNKGVANPKKVTKVAGYGAILVVEDEPGILSMLRKMLTAAGFETYFCGDADRAFAQFGNDADHIDVLLTDMVMPGKLQGLSLAAKMTERYPRMRVVCISGYASEAQQSPAGYDMVDSFLTKPISRIDLIDALNRSVEKARLVEGLGLSRKI